MASQPQSTDDAIRERHGMRCTNDDSKLTSVTIWEGEQNVYLDHSYTMRVLTPYQARYLASKLYRLSRRIRARGEGA